jgi:L-amino acid N-acyltransferase YncA
MNLIHLRDAQPDDSSAIASIYEHYVHTTCFTFEEVPPSADEMGSRMRKIREAGLPYYVAEGRNSAVVGYAYASLFHTRSAYRYLVENSVYIAHDQVRQGIGKALMERLIQNCTALGYRQMVALIGIEKENPASVGLHSCLGFKPAGKLSAVGLKFGRWVDVMEMQLALGEGPNSIPTADPIGRSNSN